MSVYKPAKSPFYSFDFRRGGQRYVGSTGKTERREAEAEERLLIQQAERVSGPDGRTGIRRNPDRVPSLADAADRYWSEVCQHGASPDADMALLARLTELVGPSIPITAINDAAVSKAVASRRAQFRKDNPKLGRVSASTVNRSVTEALRRILYRARKVWKFALPEEPNWRAHRLSEPTERVRELRYDEEVKLEQVEREEYRAPRIFAPTTGLRRREVVGLLWEQVDFATEVVRVVGKGDKPHVVPLTAELVTLLRSLQGHHPTHVFTFISQRSRRCTKSGRSLTSGLRYPITEQGLATEMRRTLDRAGIRDFRPMHDFRHTAASRALRATGNLRLVQKLLNHSSPATTAKYAHANLDDLREGMVMAAEDSAQRRIKLTGELVRVDVTKPSPLALAIASHRMALDAIRAAPPFDADCPASVGLDDAEAAGLQAVLAAPCESREDAAALLAHLRPYVAARGSAFGTTLRDDGEVACEVAEAVLAALAVVVGDGLPGRRRSAPSSPAIPVAAPHCLA